MNTIKGDVRSLDYSSHGHKMVYYGLGFRVYILGLQEPILGCTLDHTVFLSFAVGGMNLWVRLG